MIDEIKKRHQHEKEKGSYINEQQCFDDREWLIKEVVRLQEREFNHYTMEIEGLESRIFKLTDDLEAAHDALEMLPPKEVELSERTQFKINETVSKLLAEQLKKNLEIAVMALEEYSKMFVVDSGGWQNGVGKLARDTLNLLK